MHRLASQTHHEEHVKSCVILARYQPGFVQRVSEQRLYVVNAVPREITSFTDKMRIRYRMRDIVQP